MEHLGYFQPPWRNWIARGTSNPEVVVSSTTEGVRCVMLVCSPKYCSLAYGRRVVGLLTDDLFYEQVFFARVAKLVRRRSYESEIARSRLAVSIFWLNGLVV